MKHLALVQAEFLKIARKWHDLTYDEQKAYLQRHPLSRRKLTARPSSGEVATSTSDDLHKKYIEVATDKMEKGYVVAVPRDGKKQYYKLKDGKLWTSQYENTDWILDESQKLPYAHGAIVVGPALQTFDKAQRSYANTYFKTTEEVPAWILTGHSPSGSYYGSSNILTPIYERKKLPVGTSIQILAGGDFAVINGQRQPVRFTDPAADKSPFEKDYGYDPTKKQLPLKALQEVTAEGTAKQPVKQEVKEVPVTPTTTAPTKTAVPTKPPKSMSKQEIAKLLSDSGIADSARYSDKKGGFIFKRGYFYRHGMDSDKFANAIMARSRNVGLTPVLVDSADKWNRWPKGSWFEAVVKFEQMKDETERQTAHKSKGFPADDILQSMKTFGFPSSGASMRDLDIEKDRDGNVSRIGKSFRYLGTWYSRPGEEDDDQPTWDRKSEKYYKQVFEDWSRQQPWFNSKTMDISVEPSEKAWVSFDIVKKA